MSKVILLDSAPVGLITNPKATLLALHCQQWVLSLSARGYEIILPEIGVKPASSSNFCP